MGIIIMYGLAEINDMNDSMWAVICVHYKKGSDKPLVCSYGTYTCESAALGNAIDFTDTGLVNYDPDDEVFICEI
jgi:hypothetical protein